MSAADDARDAQIYRDLVAIGVIKPVGFTKGSFLLLPTSDQIKAYSDMLCRAIGESITAGTKSEAELQAAIEHASHVRRMLFAGIDLVFHELRRMAEGNRP